MNTVLNIAGQLLLGLPSKAPKVATQGETGWNSVIYHTRIEVRLFCRLIHMKDEISPPKHLFVLTIYNVKKPRYLMPGSFFKR